MLNMLQDYAKIFKSMSLEILAKAFVLWKNDPQEFWDIIAIVRNEGV